MRNPLQVSFYLFVTFLVVTIFVSSDHLARRVFLWDSSTINLSRDFVEEMQHEKAQKQNIVGYLFHEGVCVCVCVFPPLMCACPMKISHVWM